MIYKRKNILQKLRYKLPLLVFFILLVSQFIFVPLKNDSIFSLKSINFKAAEKNTTGKLKNNTPFLLKNTPNKPLTNNSGIDISLFEIENEDDFSCSKKSFKLDHQTTIFSLINFVGNNSNRNVFGIVYPSIFSKLHLYISYQVFRI